MDPLDICVDESVELIPLGEIESVLDEDVLGENMHYYYTLWGIRISFCWNIICLQSYKERNLFNL